MTQSSSDLFGQNATIANGKLAITLADLVDTNGNPYLADTANSTPSQIATAWIAYLHHSQTPELDENDQPVVDKTQAIVPQSSFAPKTYEVRDQEEQIRNEFLFAVYTVDYSVFDPDNVV